MGTSVAAQQQTTATPSSECKACNGAILHTHLRLHPATARRRLTTQLTVSPCLHRWGRVQQRAVDVPAPEVERPLSTVGRPLPVNF
jgi:hypothetical protein